jgi:hypothetical protein
MVMLWGLRNSTTSQKGCNMRQLGQEEKGEKEEKSSQVNKVGMGAF